MSQIRGVVHGEPDAGEKSGKNAALDRPAHGWGMWRHGCRHVRTKEDRDLVSRGTEREAKDEQEGFGVYESEVAVLLHGAFDGLGGGGGRCGVGLG